MSDNIRMTISKDKNDKWRAFYKKNGKTQENWVADSRELLWDKVKSDLSATKHYSRRYEWVVSFDEIVQQKNEE